MSQLRQERARQSEREREGVRHRERQIQRQRAIERERDGGGGGGGGGRGGSKPDDKRTVADKKTASERVRNRVLTSRRCTAAQSHPRRPTRTLRQYTLRTPLLSQPILSSDLHLISLNAATTSRAWLINRIAAKH